MKIAGIASGSGHANIDKRDNEVALLYNHRTMNLQRTLLFGLLGMLTCAGGTASATAAPIPHVASVELLQHYAGAYEPIFNQLLVGFNAERGTARDRRRPTQELQDLWRWPASEKDNDRAITIRTAHMVRVPEAPHRALLLLAVENDDGDRYATLALIQTSPRPAVLATLGVQKDQRVDFFEENTVRLYPLAAHTWGLWLDNHHSNSGETFQTLTMLRITATGVHPIYDGPALYHTRTAECTTAMRPNITLLASTHGPYRDVQMVVTKTKACGGQTPITLQTFRATLTWDARRQKYMGGSKALLRDYR